MKKFLSDTSIGKRNMKIFISMLTFSFALMNCGKSKSGPVLKPETTEIQGALGTAYEVIDKEYKITDGGGMFKLLSIQIKRKSGDLPFEPDQSVPYGTSHAGKDTHVGLGIELMDGDGNTVEVVQATASGMGGVYSSDDITSVINLQNGETGTVRWSVDENLLSKVKSFRITSAVEKNKSRSNINSAAAGTVDDYDDYLEHTSYDDHSGGITSIDQMLDSYEQYMDEYIQLTQNLQSGSAVSSMDSYSELLNKQADLSEKLNNIKGTMTPAQTSRFIKIQAKTMNAIGYQ